MFIELPIGLASQEEINTKKAVDAYDEIEWEESTVSINPVFVEAFWGLYELKRTMLISSSGETYVIYLDYKEVKRRLKNARLMALTEGIG